MPDEQLKERLVTLSGKLVTAIDASTIGDNFQVLQNLRYTDGGVRSIGGMAKINTVANTNPKIRSMFHFNKSQPQESHLMMQAWDSGLTTSSVYSNSTAIPNQGNADAVIRSDASGASTGRFDQSSQGELAYCNGVEPSMIWGGNEFRCGGWISYDAAGTGWYDYTDEVTNTLSDSANVATFPTSPATAYIGSLRPLRGFKLYIKTANASAATMTVRYWDGSAWQLVAGLVDGTSVGGKSLAQTGSITFTDTLSIAKIQSINGVVLYWYKISLTAVDLPTSIYYVTLNSSLQQIKDIWDGIKRAVTSAKAYNNVTNKFTDNTVNLANIDSLYQQFGNMTTNYYWLLGFTEPMMGVYLTFVAELTNTTVSALIVEYWNGNAWVAVTGLNDGTANTAGATFNQNGLVSWQPVGIGTEFKTQIDKDIPLYFYKFRVSVNFAAEPDLRLDMAQGIPAQHIINIFSFPLFSNNRLFLCDEVDNKRNSALCSAAFTSSVFNGSDSTRLYFGDDLPLTAGAWLYSQFGSNLYSMTIFCKATQTWLLVGSGPKDWVQYQASNRIGCVAPLTMRVMNLDPLSSPELAKYIAIWQGAEGIYMFDGKILKPLHLDILDYFDPKNSSGLNRSKTSSSYGFFDPLNQEYHWLSASGNSTTLNKEYVYDVRRNKWYNIDRNGVYLQTGTEVIDTNGNAYTYGSLDSGFVERLDNGNTFDGNSIISILQTGDMPLEPSVFTETEIRYISPVCKAKTVTTNSIAGTWYGDTNSTGTTFTSSVANSGHRLSYPINSVKFGPALLHSIKLSMTTTNETYGFEPLMLGLLFRKSRLKTKQGGS